MSVRLMDAVLLLNYIIKKSEGPVLAGPSAIFAVLAAALEWTHIDSAGAERCPGHWRLLECLGVKA